MVYVRRGRKTTKKPMARKGRKRVYKRSTVASMVKRALTKYSPKVEKKSVDVVSSGTQYIGQVNGASASGHWVAELSPIPSVGTGPTGMIGTEVSLTSAYYDFQFLSQNNMVLGQKIKIIFLQVLGTPINVASLGAMFFDPTAFIAGGATLYDYNSPRNIDYIKNFKVLGTRYASIKPDTYSGQGNRFVRIKGGFKFKKPITVRFSGANLSEGQICAIMVADSGNVNNVNASTISNIPSVGISTGTTFHYSWRNYYTDA